MGYSRSGVARFLVVQGAPDPFVRSVLVKLLAVCWSDGSGQFVAHHDVVDVLGEYSAMFAGWGGGDVSLMARAQMIGDVQAGGCVATMETLLAFLTDHCPDRDQLMHIVNRASPHAMGGVITTHSFGVYIPESLMPAWLEFIGLPAEVHDPDRAL